MNIGEGPQIWWSDPDRRIPRGRVNWPTKQWLAVRIRRHYPSDLYH